MINNDTRFLGIDSTKVDLTKKKDALNNAVGSYFTAEEINEALNGITGTGTINRVARFDALNGITGGQIIDNGSWINNPGSGGLGGNSAFGELAFQVNTTGDLNIAFGLFALFRNTTGNFNTIVGSFSGENIVNGSFNTGVGTGVLNKLVAVNGNSAFGNNALKEVLSSINSAFGIGALELTTTGSANCAFGNNALRLNTTGSGNSALGSGTNSGNFSSSVILGRDATATASNQFVVGSAGTVAGAVVAEVNTSSNVWNVVINGVARKILLA